MPFTKRIKRSKFLCSFNEGFNTPMNNASTFFLRWSFIGALHKNDCVGKLMKFFNEVLRFGFILFTIW